MAALVAIFVRYPAHIVGAVTEPATGLPSKSKFPPSLAEVTQALQAEIELQRRLSPYTPPLLPIPKDIQRNSTAERVAHVERLRAEGKLVFGEERLHPRGKSGWITPAQAVEILARHERETNQNQTIDEEQL